MAWARLDDQFADHPKVRSLGVFSMALQAAAICHCARYLTDGFLSWSAADQLVAGVMAPFTLPDGQIVTPAVTSGMSGDDASSWDWKGHMVECGLWEKTRKGYLVHDYLDYNPLKQTVLEERTKGAIRVAKHRASRNVVTSADSNGHVSASPSPSPSPSPKADRQTKSEPLSGKPDVSPLRVQAQGILDYLNKRSGRSFRPTDTNIGVIVARIKDGASADQCRAVIGLRAAKWKGDPKMEEYLRPMTLFRRSNFDQYMGDLPVFVPEEGAPNA